MQNNPDNSTTGLAFSLEELNKELGIDTEDANASSSNASSTNASSPSNKSFLTKQYTLFSLPFVSVYLQGVIPTSSLESLDASLKAVKVRAINHPSRQAAPQVTSTIIDSLKMYSSQLYSSEHKQWHIDIVKKAAALGIAVDPNKCLKREAAIKTFEEYQAALIDFLLANNYSSPEEYLNKENKGAQQFTANDIDNLELDF